MEKLERIAKEQKVAKSDLIRGWIHSFPALNPAEQDVIVSTYGKVSLNGGVKVLGIRLVDYVLNELDEIAKRNDVSRSDVIRSIMVFKIERYKEALKFLRNLEGDTDPEVNVKVIKLESLLLRKIEELEGFLKD